MPITTLAKVLRGCKYTLLKVSNWVIPVFAMPTTSTAHGFGVATWTLSTLIDVWLGVNLSSSTCVDRFRVPSTAVSGDSLPVIS